MEPVWTHVSYKFVKSAKTNRSFRQYFAFAKLKSSELQKKAIDEYSGKELKDRIVKISAVKEQEEQTHEEEKEEEN